MKDFQISGNGGLAVDDSNIGFLVNMTQLEMLCIRGAPGLSDISVVTNFPNLVKLQLEGCNISDVSPIAGLTNLKELLYGHLLPFFKPVYAFTLLEEKT